MLQQRLAIAFMVVLLMFPFARQAAASALVGDLNDDCVVNLLDLAIIGDRYLIGYGSLRYSPKYDLNNDHIIDIFDIQIVAAHYLQTC